MNLSLSRRAVELLTILLIVAACSLATAFYMPSSSASRSLSGQVVQSALITKIEQIPPIMTSYTADVKELSKAIKTSNPQPLHKEAYLLNNLSMQISRIHPKSSATFTQAVGTWSKDVKVLSTDVDSLSKNFSATNISKVNTDAGTITNDNIYLAVLLTTYE